VFFSADHFVLVLVQVLSFSMAEMEEMARVLYPDHYSSNHSASSSSGGSSGSSQHPLHRDDPLYECADAREQIRLLAERSKQQQAQSAAARGRGGAQASSSSSGTRRASSGTSGAGAHTAPAAAGGGRRGRAHSTQPEPASAHAHSEPAPMPSSSSSSSARQGAAHVTPSAAASSSSRAHTESHKRPAPSSPDVPFSPVPPVLRPTVASAARGPHASGSGFVSPVGVTAAAVSAATRSTSPAAVKRPRTEHTPLSGEYVMLSKLWCRQRFAI
jgi:hypothetical protein